MCVGLRAPDSMIEDTNAANSGAAQPLSLRQLGVDEVEAVERMVLVLDAAVHVHAAAVAGMALDRRAWRRRPSACAPLAVTLELVARHDRDHREQRAGRLPALGAAAGVVEGDVALDASPSPGRCAHLQVSVPPAKFSVPGLTPLSTDG